MVFSLDSGVPSTPFGYAYNFHRASAEGKCRLFCLIETEACVVTFSFLILGARYKFLTYLLTYSVSKRGQSYSILSI